jgi:DNA-binding NarL/FixJ family response regulator
VSNPRRIIERIRITLLHPHASFRTSLARLLATERDFEIVAECASVTEALENSANTTLDVILFDFSIWQGFVPAARDSGYQGKFLAIAEEIDGAHCVRALSRGVSGVVLGGDSPQRLIQAIHVVASGVAWVDQSTIQLLADRRIADQIGASESTVKATLQQLFDKTGVRTRSQLVRIMLADEAVHSG